jgi:hypothetical protein
MLGAWIVPAHGTVVYTEEGLPPAAARPAGANGVARLLHEAGTPAERRRLVRAMLAAIGFQWLDYLQLQPHAQGREGGGPPVRWLASHSPPQWIERYLHEQLFEVDFRHRAAQAFGVPLAWDLDDVRERRLARAMDELGLRSGVFLSLATPGFPGERTLVSLLSGAPRRSWIDDAVLAQSAVLALSLHEYLAVCCGLPEGV